VTIVTDSGALWFRHPLFVEVIAQTFRGGDLVDLHAFLAATWEAARDVDERDRATSLALHHVAAGDLAAGFTWALRAADGAEAISAWEEVSSHLSTAVSLLDRLPAVGERVDEVALRQRAGRATAEAGDDRGAVAHYEAALAKVDRSTDPVLASRILLQLHILRDLAGLNSTAHLSVAEPWDVLELLADTPESAERAQALAQLSFAETFDGRTDDARDHAEEAVALATTSGGVVALIWAFGARGQSRWGTDEGIADSARAFSLAEKHGDPQLLCWACIFLSNSYESAGRYADVVRVTDAAYRALRDRGSFDSAAVLGAIGALRSFQLGRWSLVRSRVREVLTLARSDNSAGVARCVAAVLTAHEGNPTSSALHLRRAEELLSTASPVGDPLVDAQIQVAIAVGRPLSALELIRTHMAEALQVSPIAADEWLQLASRAASQLADRPPGDPDRGTALRLLEEVEELRGQEPPPFRSSGPLDLVHPALGTLHLAQRAHCADVGAEAVELWAAACEATEHAEMSFEHARALTSLARLLLTRRLDRGRAAAALTTARGLAVELGATPLVNDIDALEAQTHLHLSRGTPSRGTRRPAMVRSDPPLTRREGDVVEGLLAGETYAQIGARLFISEKTVSSHVSNILRKTGTTSRIQLADLANSAVPEAP
jgi:DNA-binding CsgD family transcriptional regulator/tetratricopeptide (TPR) repeat protein